MDTSKPAWLLARDIHIANQKRENERQSNFQQKRIDNVMNQTTAPTGLYGANKTVVPKKLHDTVQQVLDNNKAVQTATKTLNTNLYNSRNKQIDNKNKRQF